ncbi:MAG: hypothetical protein OXU69_04805 [Gemmatimonadota bacterium]|nr:hypothetical protein [Gemmatimonadota bacterium]MDE2984007.1 hypothetical protein [Gemmatimonadota bacterium]
MNRIRGKAAVALLAVASAALAAFPAEGHAQSGLENRRWSLAALGAAIGEVKRSPFHTAGQAGRGFDPQAVLSVARPRQADGATLATAWLPSSPREAAQADTSDAAPRRTTLASILGIAAGDLIGLGLASRTEAEALAWTSYLALSPSLTALATSLAGVSPGVSFASAFLGTGLGLGTGWLTVAAMDDSLSYGVGFIPGVIVYYGVRIGATLGAIRLLDRKGRG